MIPIPAIIKIFTVFGLVLLLNRLRLQLSLALMLGSVVLGLWMGLNPWLWVKAVIHSITQLQTISLLLIVWLILVMSRIMEQTGHMERLVNAFAGLTRDARTVSSVMPALIGLLPMPGGALFSAPMVETSLSGHSVSNEQKTLINYWFRHIWEFWWPLYPGVVLALALLEVDTWRFLMIMAPLSIISATAGVVFLLKPIGKKEMMNGGHVSWAGIKAFLFEFMPILIVILVIIFISGLKGVLGLADVSFDIPGSISILPGLLAALIWVCTVNHVAFRLLKSSLANKSIMPMLFLLAAIMVFKGIMVESEAVVQIRNELMAYRIPVILVILIMPFISGIITGIAVGFVGTSFPLIIPLFQTPHFFDFMSYVAVAYTFGYMGMMLSPMHLCFLVTKDYYQANLLRSYRTLVLPALMVMITVSFLFMAYRAL